MPQTQVQRRVQRCRLAITDIPLTVLRMKRYSWSIFILRISIICTKISSTRSMSQYATELMRLHAVLIHPLSLSLLSDFMWYRSTDRVQWMTYLDNKRILPQHNSTRLVKNAVVRTTLGGTEGCRESWVFQRSVVLSCHHQVCEPPYLSLTL
jgi:hypothetical protein